MAVDPATNKIYWANYGNNTISFANLDGSGGGGNLSTTGVTPDFPQGVALDPAANKIYWTNPANNTISFANLTGGGGTLNTSGVTLFGPEGVAIDHATNKIYWGDSEGTFKISFANLDDSGGGGNLSTSPVTPNSPSFPVLLQQPSGAGVPVISGGTVVGSVLSCSQGAWSPDLLPAFEYLAPQSFALAWSENGTPIPGGSTVTASSPGSYTCTVTATNHAGSSTQTSSAFAVAALPPPVVVPPQSTSVSFGNQRITLTSPSLRVCTASTKTLGVSLRSTAIAKSKAAKLKFTSAVFYLDKGVKHTKRKTVRAHGKTKTVTVITYTANATAHHVPVALALKLAGLKTGTHTLTVKLSYKQTKTKRGRKTTVTVSKTLKAKFLVC